MLTHLKKRIDQLRRYLIYELICVIILIIFLGLLFEVLLYIGFSSITHYLLGICGICIFLLIFIASCKQSFTNKMKLYTIPIDAVCWKQVCTHFSASEILPDAYVSFYKWGSQTIRLLFLYCTRYSKETASKQRKSANRIINKRYNVSSPASLFEAKARSRVNILVCKQKTDELLHLLEMNSRFLRKQNEIVFTVAVILEDQTLIVPDCSGEFNLSELTRYSNAVSLLTCQFGLDRH